MYEITVWKDNHRILAKVFREELAADREREGLKLRFPHPYEVRKRVRVSGRGQRSGHRWLNPSESNV